MTFRQVGRRTMADITKVAGVRLDTVSRLATEPPMTVDAALRLPALRRGAPEVLAGADQLGRTVGWAHSCEGRPIPELLEGDEILLVTGQGLGGGAARPPRFR